MKKSLAYVMTAVLLGAVIMILPWASVNRTLTMSGINGFSEDKGPPLPRAAFGGVITPLGFVGLMLAVSLILALGVYLFSKRRMPL